MNGQISIHRFQLAILSKFTSNTSSPWGHERSDLNEIFAEDSQPQKTHLGPRRQRRAPDVSIGD